ncbi:LLM class flavin-dependent oxidoreductase [Methylobacillus methanolivorans]
MPVEFVGGLFPRNQYAPRQGASAKLDLEYLRDLARAHEHAGFDRVLIANGGGDPAYLAAYAASQTEHLGFMIAHRPALQSPALAARAYATLDHITGGRIRLHAITGHAIDAEHGDTLADKAQRYERAGEYLDIVRRLWTTDKPFDYEGKYFQLKDTSIPLKPLQQPHIPISLGGSSDVAYEVAVRHTDLYALWAEPLADIAERIAKLRRVAEVAGVPAPRVSLSARLIIGPTEDIAWQRAYEIVERLKQNHQGIAPQHLHAGGALRQQEIAARGDRHDRALYMATSTAIGTGADTTSLVGTPDTIVQSLLDYYDLGVTTFLNRGYEPLYDAVDYGRYIISTVREEVRRRDEYKLKQAAA